MTHRLTGSALRKLYLDDVSLYDVFEQYEK